MAIDVAQRLCRIGIPRVECEDPQHRRRGALGVAGTQRGVPGLQVVADALAYRAARRLELRARRIVAGGEQQDDLPLACRSGVVAGLRKELRLAAMLGSGRIDTLSGRRRYCRSGRRSPGCTGASAHAAIRAVAQQRKTTRTRTVRPYLPAVRTNVTSRALKLSRSSFP